MPTSSYGPQQLRDRIVQTRVYQERDQFIASIDEDQVCQLASSYRNGHSCRCFQPPVRGSYNICFFVEFEDKESWVVRVPLEPCLAFGGKYKLESEIATLQYALVSTCRWSMTCMLTRFSNRLVAERTTIPVPRVIAYALSENPEPLSSFLILEYVQGQKLSSIQLTAISDEQRRRLYTSLADIYIQLRRLEFPSIGCLAQHQDEFKVSKKTTSIDINMQELEGLRPSVVQSSYYTRDNLLTSANDYVAMLLDVMDNAFAEGRSSVLDEEEGRESLYHLHIFRQYAEKWVDPRLARGPFVLIHGDLGPQNLLVNEDLDIVSVLDWEWSRVVPLQFFSPPLWLSNPDTTKLAYPFLYREFLKRFDQLQAILRIQERQRYGSEMLFDEWTSAKVDSGFLVANALENWTDVDWFAFRFIHWKCYGGKTDLSKRVAAFVEADPSRKELIARKVREGIQYEIDVGRLRDSESEHGLLHTALKRLGLCRPWRDTVQFINSVSSAAFLGLVAVTVLGTSYALRRRTIRLS
jgi:hypothetical protein